MNLLYYGVELDKEKSKNSDFSWYTKGVYSYELKDGEDEQEVREEIEKRCRENPDSLFCGIRIEHFRWLN
jgi:hypothetical protein